MKIKKLNLHNFGNIENASIDLTNGLTLFTGDNGSGKSTILQAISLHLFNFTTRNLEDYINWGSSSFTTSIEFDHNGKQFKQTINYSKKVSERELYIDNIFYKNSDAIKILNTLFDPKLSLASAISFEGEIDLIQVKPAQRREYLKKIYDLEFSKGVEDLETQHKELENNVLVSLDKDIYLLENTSYDLKELLKQEISQQEYDQYKTQLEMLLSQKLSFEKEKELFDLNKKSYEFIKSKLETERLSKETIQNKLNLTLQKSYEKEEQELVSLESELNAIKLVRIKSFNDSYLTEKYKELATFESNLKNSQANIILCKKGICPTCGKSYTSDDLGLYETEEENITLMIKNLELEIESLEKEKNNCKIQEEEQRSLKQKNENLQLIIKHKKELLEQQKLNTQKELTNLSETLTKVNDNITQLESELLPLVNYFASHTEPSIDLDIFKKIEFCGNTTKKYENITLLNAEIQKENILLVQKQQVNEEKLKSFKIRKDQIYQEIEELKRCKVILQKEFPNFVISNVTATIEQECNNFINKTYNGRYQLKIQEKKDSLIIVYGEKDKEVSSASGYEKQLFSLAWKFALGKLQNLGIIILDEVDAQATEENSERLFSIIGNIQDMFQQIFVITHRENTKEVLSNNYKAKIFEAKDNTITPLN